MKKLSLVTAISIIFLQVNLQAEHAYSHEEAKKIAHHLENHNQDESIKYFASSGNLRILQFLIENCGLSKNYQEKNGKHSLLQMVIQQQGNSGPINQVALVKYLLEKGANPNIQSKAGNTPLLYAVKWCIGHQVNKADALAIVELLMKYKADPNIPNNNKEDVFDWLNVLAGRESNQEFAQKIGKSLYKDSYLAYNIRKIIDEAMSR